MSDKMVECSMTVRELMTVDIVTVSPSTSVGEALNVFHDNRVSALPVVENDRCIGIVTAVDLVVLLRAVDQTLRSDYPHYEDCLWAVDLVQKKFDADPVRNIMSEIVVTIGPDQSACDAATLMSRESVHHLPVVQDDKLLGFISSLDLVRVLKD